MEINGERVIAATQQAVWEAINDPEMLKLCIPGCEKVERVDASQMKAVVMARIGPVRARFSGKVTMADVTAPDSCTMHFEGTGGPAGFAKGQAKVALFRHPDGGTLLVFSSSASVGGKLGQIGGRLIESAARAISDEFFNNLAAQLSPAGAVPPPQAAAVQKAIEKPQQAVQAAESIDWMSSRWLLAIGCVVLGVLAGKLF
jgi:carbon monoxide dehydrogenase subunit G